jgi:autotransporter-associated beta strand protein
MKTSYALRAYSRIGDALASPVPHASLAAVCGLLVMLGLVQPGAAQTLLLRYSFDEATSGTGAAYDSSGAAPQSNGTFQGTATRTTTTIGGTPVAAVDVGSPTGYIDAGDVDKIDGLSQLTLTAWIRLYGDPVNGEAIMGKMDSSTGNPGFALLFGLNDTNGIFADRFSIKVRINGTAGGGSGNISASNAWVFVAMTYDGTLAASNLKYYTGRSGTAVAQSGTTKTYNRGAVQANSLSFRAPTYGISTVAAPMMIDDVRVYSGVLTVDQLEAIRQANFPPTLSWDVNGATPGAGSAPAEVWSGSGVWTTNNNWTSSTNGDLATQQWSDGSIALFSAGTDATGTYTVSVTNAPTASAVNVEFGNVTFEDGSVTLIGNQSIDVASGSSATFNSTALAGTGGLTKTGNGTLTLGQADGYSGNTTIMGGTLALGAGGSINNSPVIKAIIGTFYDVSAVSGGYVLLSGQTLKGQGTIIGSVTVASGATLAPGGSVGTINFNNDLILAGNLFIEVDKSLSPSNDVALVTGTLTNAGTGTLTVTNLGATPLVAGDRFTLFNKPLANGSALTIVSDGGVVWTNKLESDGSIEVVSVGSAGQSYLQWTVTGGNTIGFTWTNANVQLQAQTNANGIQLGNSNWFDYPGGGSSPVNVPIDPTGPPVFFRLRSQ